MKIHLFSINNVKIYFSEQFQEQTKIADREFNEKLIIIHFHIHYNTLKNICIMNFHLLIIKYFMMKNKRKGN